MVHGPEARLFPPDEALHFGTGFARAGGKASDVNETAAMRLKSVFDTLEDAAGIAEEPEAEPEAPAPAPALLGPDDLALLDDDGMDDDEEADLDDVDDDVAASQYLRMTGFARSAKALPGGDATAALNALKFALAHPLSDVPEELGGAARPSFARPTLLSTHRRDLVMSELVQARRAERQNAPPNEAEARAESVKSIEKMLAEMRERLADVERGLLERRARDAVDGHSHAGAAAAAVQPGLS